MPTATDTTPVHHRLAERLRKTLQGDVLFDRFSRGRYATDASHYQIEPVGVVVPKNDDDVREALRIGREEGVALLPRGGGTSQSGQTVGRALVLDFSKHLKRIVAVDAESRTCTVEPGIVLDDLNRQLKPSGLWFPVDVSTASRATIGGMTGNNSCGTRSIRYGIMRDNVIAIDAILADGSEAKFGEVGHNLGEPPLPAFRGQRDGVGGSGTLQREHSEPPLTITLSPQAGRGDPHALFRDLMAFGQREEAYIAHAFPEVSRRVGGYLIDALLPGQRPVNLATLLCGSEGTLAVSRRIQLKLSPLPRNKALGICHFAAFRKAMEAAQHIVKLGPVAVEVVDRTLIELARDIAMFRPVMETYVQGRPDALLLVEFAEDEQAENLTRLDRLDELMGDLGHPHSVVKVPDAAGQKAVWEVRASGLNIMMSMKSEGKPVSFIEDCAVPLEHLADYTERLTQVFERHGTRGTFYAHASVGCLHVRPVLNLKLEKDARTMRKIAEEAFAMVAEYKGSHSGEHGDGLVRSEFHARMYGPRTVRLFEEVKDRFDPAGVLNPGKIVRASRMDDRTLFRFKPDYRVPEIQTALDWSGYIGAGGGFQGAVEMCNNNGECRKQAAGVMCPSFRVTGNERDVTRGRANTLRLAISGQLGPGALASDEMLEAVKLCVSCKGCRRECPTGVDMAKMKIEVLAAANRRRRLPLRDRLVAYLPRYAPYAARLAPLMNLRDRVPGMAWLSELVAGFSAKRPLPRWNARPFVSRQRPPSPRSPGEGGREVALLADTFNRYFEPDILHAAVDVLGRLGYHVTELGAPGGGRPLCCGRTFLAAGLVEQARAEARRLLAAALPLAQRGVPIVGLEPSCLLTLRDELISMLPGAEATQVAGRAVLFEELLAEAAAAGRIPPSIATSHDKVVLHGHCHQKAFGAMDAVRSTLALVEGLDVETVESSCCGMAGAFGYAAETYDVSLAMGELSLLPAVRSAAAEAVIAADGFSCRHQIEHGSGRRARHVAQILRDSMGVGNDNTAKA
ncbi:MAG TPA: FAD-linked oxidase C-terminal domain-containing protein [Hyphomicrobiaceae bacterium]|nr:FAD-linked oxidase C-terminal domain-containing protein [Hyphomicrobiaceae bacterium]